MIAELLKIKELVGKAKGTKAQNLASAINPETLTVVHNKMSGRKAVGVDGISKEAYGRQLGKNVVELVNRMKREAYKPKPSLRVYIDKPGSKDKRPLGISAYEDKLVENVIAQLLEIVYEPKFLNCSYGFRPRRNCHQAVREVIEDIQYRKTNYIVEADIHSFFDTLDHEWPIRFLEHDIADKKFIGVIKRFLKAGVMENGKTFEKETGSPQGNGASPILANIYLHYVLDLWFEKVIKKEAKGEAYLIRYADDFLCCFQYKSDAEAFYRMLPERFAKFGLALAADKTKLLEFGRFAKRNCKSRGERKPDTFNFLGFTFYCSGDSRKQFFRVKVKTDRKKEISKLKKLNEWLKTHRHLEIAVIIKKVNQALMGYYRYYGVTDNTRELERFKHLVLELLYKWMNRRSQRKSYTWESFRKRVLSAMPLAQPKVYVSLFYR